MLQAQKLESVGQLTGGIAHDFNNLLVVIQGYLELAQDVAGDDQDLTEFHGHIQDASDRAAALTHKLLSFSRRQIMDTHPLDLNDLLTEIGELIRRVVPETIDYELIADKDIGTVVGDPGELEQVVLNLAVNARDAMPSGGQLTIETKSVEIDQDYVNSHPMARVGSYVLLQVSDTGEGVPDEIRERIFEPFFTTKPAGAGTGLGLSVLFGVVQQHNGFTDLASTPGKGTVFSVYLPVEDKSPGIVNRSVPVEVTDGIETLLLVEDEKEVRELAGKFLARTGYRVIFAADGEEAVNEFMLHRAEVALVILDVVLPRLGGHEVMAEIHKVSPGTPVLFTSGYSATGIHTDFVLEEELVLLQKPYSREQLLMQVREMIDANAAD